MNTIKFSNDLFLGRQELEKMIGFLNAGAKFPYLIDTFSFGLFRDKDNVIGNNFLVEEGSSAGTIKIATDSNAVNADGDIIIQKAIDNLSLINDSAYYWVKIEYTKSDYEEGTVSIDSVGNLIGIGTSFLSIFRSGGRFPTKIKFKQSILNTYEYEVLDVLNDTNAILNGVFTNESDLRFSIVGSFTPGLVVPEVDKYPFQYDSCIISLVPEVTPDTPPAKVDDYEFFIARVRYDGAVVFVADKRTEFYSTRVENIVP